MNLLNIRQHLAVQTLKHGSGFKALGIRGDTEVLDPFLMVDHFWMSQPTFGAHPHAGFSAVTYMFEDAQTGFQNRDSLGDASMIHPGDSHWTIAGSGVVHDEVPITPGQIAHGLQMFINLAAAKKQKTAESLHIKTESMAVFNQVSGTKIKVVFGTYNDDSTIIAAAQALPTDATLLDISLDTNSMFNYPVAVGKTAFLTVVKGEVVVDGEILQETNAVAFSREGGLLKIQATVDSQVALFMGQPLREPVARHGPFAMSTEAELAQVIAAYQNGEFGEIKNTVNQ